MTARKRTAKRAAGRGSKATKSATKTAAKSAKNSASRKGKASKTLTKLEKAALAARKKAALAKAAAKSAAQTKPAAKTKSAAKISSTASKSARAPVKQKVEAAAKSAAGAPSAKIPPTPSHAKEPEILSGAKIKAEAKSSAHVKTLTPPPVPNAHAVAAAKPAVAVSPHRTPASPTVEATVAAPVVALQGVAKQARPLAAETVPAQRAEEAAAPAAQKPVKHAAPRHGFKANEFVVYPAHGVGQIVAIEEQEVAGFRLELFVITFVKDKMMLRVPVAKAPTVGMRKLSDPDLVKRALDTLLGRARIKRTMWSRRAQEYEAKINSGDLIAIAEVVRDLYRSEAQPEQSYSERQLYEAALDRMAREVAVVQKLGETEALKVIEGQLQKGQRRGKADASATPGEPAADGDVEEAA
jgi:CarD family transcriptional regulator